MNSSICIKGALISVLWVVSLLPAVSAGLCDYNGMYLFSQEHPEQYLGYVIDDQYDSESIINDYGTYGSRYSSTSIRNQYSAYGSSFGTYSAYNSFASYPPIIWRYINDRWEAVAYLTKNTFKQPAVDPDNLILTLRDGCYQVIYFFRPLGWVYQNAEYLYDLTSGEWYWFSPNDIQWVYQLGGSTPGWHQLLNSGLSSGWSYYQWPYAYDYESGFWHFFNEADRPWIVNLRTGEWMGFGNVAP
jgi:hypothetical protein